MISRSMTPLAFLTAGPLADYLFEPAMREGGALAQTALGAWMGAGAGRGIGLMFVLSGVTLVVASAFAFANPRICRVEDELADALPDAPPQPSEESSPAIEIAAT